MDGTQYSVHSTRLLTSSTAWLARACAASRGLTEGKRALCDLKGTCQTFVSFASTSASCGAHLSLYVKIMLQQLSHCSASCSSSCQGRQSLVFKPCTRSSCKQRLPPARKVLTPQALSDSVGSSLSDLQQELNAAVSAEDYFKAAALRDQLE